MYCPIKVYDNWEELSAVSCSDSKRKEQDFGWDRGFNSLKFIGAKYPSFYPQCIKFPNASFFKSNMQSGRCARVTYGGSAETQGAGLDICIYVSSFTINALN